MEDILNNLDFGLIFFAGLMKKINTYYFYGNWKHKNGYIGEPQITIKNLIDNIKKQNIRVEMVNSIDEIKKLKSNSYKVFIFGRATTIIIRSFLCVLSGVGLSNIYFIVSKKKTRFADIVFYLRNVDSIIKMKYLAKISLMEALIPITFYRLLLRVWRGRVFAVCFPSNIIDKSKIFLCKSLEKKYLKNIVFSSKRQFNKNKVSLIYFGRDSYLRGVDLIKDLSGTYEDYNFYSTGIFPFKGDLGKSGNNSSFQSYHNNKNILQKVNKATFSIFPFRTKTGGPDVPATLIESFLIGVPPVISYVLLFDVLEKYKYPLVIDSISAGSIKKCITKNIKNKRDYKKLVDLCLLIRKEIINKYGYDFSKINV